MCLMTEWDVCVRHSSLTLFAVQSFPLLEMCKTTKVREMKSNFLRCVSKKFEANGSRENRKPNTTRWQPPKKVTCAIDKEKELVRGTGLLCHQLVQEQGVSTARYKVPVFFHFLRKQSTDRFHLHR